MGSQILPYIAKHGITPLFVIIILLLAHALPFSVAQRSPDSAETDPYANMKFSPSLVIIIVVLISALFFMGFFFIYIRRRYDSTIASAVRPAGPGENHSRPGAARGLDEEVLETFPTFVYSEVKSLKKGNGALECAVCLNEFQDDETLRLIPKCDHVFHTECIDIWLESHTTCPVCRANLVPQPGESTPQASELRSDVDLEAQNDTAASETSQETLPQGSHPPEPQVISVNFANQKLNRNRTRGSRSGRPRRFPRSHSTGHSLVQPGEDTERFTLRLPADVREQIMNRELKRSRSLVFLPREASSRRGYRTGGGEGSSRRRNSRRFESDRWVFSMTPPFFQRASSLRSTKVAAEDANESSVKPASSSSESSRPPV